MNILFLHNKYKIGGGEDISTAAEILLLKNFGHKVNVIYLDNSDLTGKSKIKLALETVWSFKSYRLVLKELLEHKYDILHVQNFFPQFSPSVFYAARKAGVKVVMSIRNYRLICPNALLYVNDNICDLCVGKTIPYPSLSRKCYRKSISSTFVAAFMLAFHNIVGTWKRQVDGFIAISDFVKNQMIKGGLSEEKIFVKYNFVKSYKGLTDIKKTDCYVYVGRLSAEKGIMTMLETFVELRDKKLVIIGEGPLNDIVRGYSETAANIVVFDKQPLEVVYKMISESKALIFPSEWYEPFGRTIIEAFSCGVPVIAARKGGASELISHGFNGILYDSSKVGLKASIDIFENLCLKIDFCKNAYNTYLEKFTETENYNQLMSVYNKVLNTTVNG